MRQSYEGGMLVNSSPDVVVAHYKRMESALMNLHPEALDLVRAEPVETIDNAGIYLKMSISYTILDPELTHHFTYGANHLMGEGLNRYTTVEGVDSETARNIQFSLHENGWAFQYPAGSDWDNTVKKFSLKEHELVTITRTP